MNSQPNPPAAATEITALLGRGTQFEGKLHFEGRVRIDGIFKGEIRSEDTLVIGDGAEVHAEIEVTTVIVRGGTIHGNVRAKSSIEIHAPGKLIGNIHSPSVFIDRGVEFQGNCRMDAVETNGHATAGPVLPSAAGVASVVTAAGGSSKRGGTASA
jgi:cytoskeletal protein CcmA (bactofilin family)